MHLAAQRCLLSRQPTTTFVRTSIPLPFHPQGPLSGISYRVNRHWHDYTRQKTTLRDFVLQRSEQKIEQHPAPLLRFLTTPRKQLQVLTWSKHVLFIIYLPLAALTRLVVCATSRFLGFYSPTTTMLQTHLYSLQCQEHGH